MADLMNEALERVARALCRSKRNGPPGMYPPGWIDRHIDENWHLFVDDARAAINAMDLCDECRPYLPNENTVRLSVEDWRRINRG